MDTLVRDQQTGLYAPQRQEGSKISTGLVVGVGLAALGLVLLLNKNGNGDDGGNGGNGDPKGEFGVIRKFNLSMEQAVNKLPGDSLFVTRLEFDYKGPPDDLKMWLAFKPRNCSGFGCDFNHGDNVMITPKNFFNNTGVSVTGEANFTFYGFNLSFFSVPVPDPRDPHTTRGGGQATLGFGVSEVWAGLWSKNKQGAAGGGDFSGEDDLFNEDYQIAGVQRFEAANILDPFPANGGTKNLSLTFANREVAVDAAQPHHAGSRRRMMRSRRRATV